MDKKQNTTITIRINNGIYEEGQKLAEKRGYTFSQLIRGLLADEIRKDKSDEVRVSKEVIFGNGLPKMELGEPVAVDSKFVIGLFNNTEFQNKLEAFLKKHE